MQNRSRMRWAARPGSTQPGHSKLGWQATEPSSRWRALQSGPSWIANARLPAARGVAACLLLYAFTWPLSRNLGEGPFVLTVILSATYCLVYRRWVLGWPYVALLAVYLAYCVFSVLNWLPLSWTDDRYVDIIPQQMSSYIALPFFTAAFFDVMSDYHRRGKLQVVLLPVLLVGWLGFGWCIGAAVGQTQAYTRVTDLSDAMFIRWSIIAFLLARFPIPLGRGLTLIVIMAAFADDSQTQITVLLMLGLLIFPYKRTVSYTFVAILAVAISIAPSYWSWIWEHDRNDGIRAVFWRDAMRAVNETHFLGVGFGTQSVQYNFADFAAFALQGDKSKVRLIGLHNSFYQSLFRCGILGLGCVVAWTAWLFGKIRHNGYLVVQCWLASAVVLSMCVNPSLESTIFVYGNAFAIALLLTLAGGACAEGVTRRTSSRWRWPRLSTGMKSFDAVGSR